MSGYPGKQGRRPLPTALKVLRGNPGRRPLNVDEPMPVPRLPSPPRELSSDAKREWRRTGRMLLRAGLFTELDVAEFASYCAAYARWLATERMLSSSSVLVKTKRGDLALNPLLRVARDAEKQFSRALVEFGMTPAARSRVRVDDDDDQDAFDRFDRRRA